MPFHTSSITPNGSALANAQAAETASAHRRAKELRDGATHLKAISLDSGADGSANPANLTDPKTVAMVTVWSGQTSDAQAPPPPVDSSEEAEALTTKPARVISFWA